MAVDSMTAIGLRTATGGVELLEQFEMAVPTLRPRDVLIRVASSGLNPVDTKKRHGFGAPGPLAEPVVLGYDAAGTVAAVGSEVTGFAVGDKVYTAGVLSRNGSNSELFAVDERIVGRAPKSLSLTQASAVPLVLLTAWEGLFESLGIKPFDPSESGKTILVLPGAGGVGSLVIQLVSSVAYEVSLMWCIVCRLWVWCLCIA